MSTAIQQLRASYAFMERNANLVKRYWAWELVWLVYSVANSLSVSYIGLGMEYLGGEGAVDGRFLVLYLVIGTLVWRYLYQQPFGMEQAVGRVPADANADDDQSEPEHTGGERLDTTVPVGVLLVGIPVGLVRGHQYDEVTGQIGQRMDTIGDQGLGVGEEAADQLRQRQ